MLVDNRFSSLARGQAKAGLDMPPYTATSLLALSCFCLALSPTEMTQLPTASRNNKQPGRCVSWSQTHSREPGRDDLGEADEGRDQQQAVPGVDDRAADEERTDTTTDVRRSIRHLAAREVNLLVNELTEV